jgi:hypothetical protein
MGTKSKKLKKIKKDEIENKFQFHKISQIKYINRKNKNKI